MTIHVDPADAERALLGWALQGGTIDDLLVEPADFYQPWHGQVWQACRDLADKGERPHPITVRRMLDGAACPHPDAGLALFELVEDAAVGSADKFADLVTAAADRRHLDGVGRKLQQMAESDRDPAEIAETAVSILSTPRRHRVSTSLLGDRFEAWMDSIEGDQPAGWSTPWPDMDDKITGWAPGRLYVVGARPSKGKSIMGVQSAVHLARRHGKAVFIASMEMTHDELVQRAVADVAGVSQTAMNSRTLAERDWQRISRSHDTITALPVTVDDTPGQTLATIKAGAREAAKSGNLGLVVVDYLQLVEPQDPRMPRHQAVGEISRGLKKLAKELGVAIIALAQLNRGDDDRKPPTMRNLRESGDIEADADVIILLHPDEEGFETTVIVEKNRHGTTGQFPLTLWGHYARFESPTVTQMA